MKVAALIARILLGMTFVVFGLNGFLHFIHAPMPTGVAGDFAGAMNRSHYFDVVAALEVIGGVLLLAGQFLPLALTILAPILVNILLFHIFMAPSGLPVALVATLLWFMIFASVRTAFSGIFRR